MTQDEWEAICQGCGACCFEKKIDRQGNVHTTAIPCRHLDIHDRSCRIYLHRLQAEEDCIKLTPENINKLSWLPECCAYRKLDCDINPISNDLPSQYPEKSPRNHYFNK